MDRIVISLGVKTSSEFFFRFENHRIVAKIRHQFSDPILILDRKIKLDRNFTKLEFNEKLAVKYYKPKMF